MDAPSFASPSHQSGGNQQGLSRNELFSFSIVVPDPFASLVSDFGIDLVHFHTRHRGGLFYRALGACRVPVIADLRDKMTDPTKSSKVADHLLCCSQGVWDFACRKGFSEKRMSLVPIPFSRPGKPPQEEGMRVMERFRLEAGRYLLFVGDITPNKGGYRLIEAFGRWRSEYPNCQLVLAGVNREGRRFIASISKAPGVRYLGPVSPAEALALMGEAEVVILPSRSEGLPRVILEALAVGTKVICPPDVPEFDRYLPEHVLSSAGADAILEKLNDVWISDVLPTFPFSEHEVGRVVDQLVEVYKRVS